MQGYRRRLAGPAPEAMSEHLERVLASPDFDASSRGRALLRFIVEETVAGRPGALSDSVIARQVFGRGADFDPARDPIVWLQAGRLRRSLERYQRFSGAGDGLRLDLPRGSYVPVWRWVSGERAGQAHTSPELLGHSRIRTP